MPNGVARFGVIGFAGPALEEAPRARAACCQIDTPEDGGRPQAVGQSRREPPKARETEARNAEKQWELRPSSGKAAALERRQQGAAEPSQLGLLLVPLAVLLRLWWPSFEAALGAYNLSAGHLHVRRLSASTAPRRSLGAQRCSGFPRAVVLCCFFRFFSCSG